MSLYWFNFFLAEQNIGITVMVLMLNQKYRPVDDRNAYVDAVTMVGDKK